MKKILLVLIIPVCFFSAFALDFDQMLDKALANSRDAESYRNDYNYQTLAIKTADMKDGFSFEAAFGDITFSDDSTFYPSATLTVGLPEIVDDLSVKASVSTSHSKTLIAGEKYTVEPSLNVSKIFTFRSYDYSVEDLAKEQNAISADSKYEAGIISVKNDLIEDLISLMQTKVEIEQLKTNISKLERKFKASVTSGSIDEGSLAEIDANKEIKTKKQSLENKEKSLANLIEDFKLDYGFDYEDITGVSESDLSFEPDINKSATVKSSALELETAKQKYEEKVGFKATISVNAAASSTVDFDKDYRNPSASYNATAGLNVNIDNLSIAASYNGDYASDTYTPSVTLSGKWSNDAKPKDVTKMEILELQNKLFTAQSNYDDAVRKYRRNSDSIKSSIQTWNEEWAEQLIDTEYNLKVLEYKSELYSKEYITLDELNEAKTEVKVDEIETLVLLLNAKQLEYKIYANNL